MILYKKSEMSPPYWGTNGGPTARGADADRDFKEIRSFSISYKPVHSSVIVILANLMPGSDMEDRDAQPLELTR